MATCRDNSTVYFEYIINKLSKNKAYRKFDFYAMVALKSRLSNDGVKDMLMYGAPIYVALNQRDARFETGLAQNIIGYSSLPVKEFIANVLKDYKLNVRSITSFETLINEVRSLENVPGGLTRNNILNKLHDIKLYFDSMTVAAPEERLKQLNAVKEEFASLIDLEEEETSKQVYTQLVEDYLGKDISISGYVPFTDELLAKVGMLNNIIVDRKTKLVYDAVYDPSSKTYIVYNDDNIIEKTFNEEEVDVVRNPAYLRPESYGRFQYFTAERLISGLFVVPGDGTDQKQKRKRWELMEELAIEAAKGSKSIMKIYAVPVTSYASNRIKGMHNLAERDNTLDGLLKRTFETYETLEQQEYLLNNPTGKIITVARARKDYKRFNLIGEINGKRFRIYSVDNYVIVGADNTTELIDFNNPLHIEEVKKLSVKETAYGARQLTDADIANLQRYYNQFKKIEEEVNAKLDTIEEGISLDVTDVILNNYNIETRNLVKNKSFFFDLIEKESGSQYIRELTVAQRDTYGNEIEGSEQIRLVPFYFRNSMGMYVLQPFLKANEFIKYNGKQYTEASFAEEVLKVNDKIIKEWLEKNKDENIKFDTNNLIVHFQDNNKLFYKIVEPIYPMLYDSDFMYMIANLGHINRLSPEERRQATIEFDKKKYTFNYSTKNRPITVNFGVSQNNTLQLEFRINKTNDLIVENNIADIEDKKTFKYNSNFNKYDIENINDLFKMLMPENQMLKGLSELNAIINAKYEYLKEVIKSKDLESINKAKISLYETLNIEHLKAKNQESENEEDKLFQNRINKYFELLNTRKDKFTKTLKELQKYFYNNVKDKSPELFEILNRPISIDKRTEFDFMLTYTDEKSLKEYPAIIFSPENLEGKLDYNQQFKNYYIIDSKYRHVLMFLPTDADAVPYSKKEQYNKFKKEVVIKPEETKQTDIDSIMPEETDAFKIGKYITVSKETERELEREKEILKNILPQWGIKENELQGILNLKDEKLLGRFKDDIIWLDKLFKAKGVAYHEAFHGVYRRLLTTEERNKLLEAVILDKKNADKFTQEYIDNFIIERQLFDKQEGDIINLIAEEILADKFSDFMQEKQKPKGLLQKLFDLLQKLINLFKQDYVQDLFEDISSGKYRTRSLTNERTFIDAAYSIQGVWSIETIPSETGGREKIAPVPTYLSTKEVKTVVNAVVARLLQNDINKESINTKSKKFSDNFEEAVDYVLNITFNPDFILSDAANVAILNKKSQTERDVIRNKLITNLTNKRFVLGARIKSDTVEVYDLNNTTDTTNDNKRLDVTNIYIKDDPNAKGQVSLEAIKEIVKEKYRTLKAVDYRQNNVQNLNTVLDEMNGEYEKVEVDEDITPEDGSRFDESMENVDRMKSIPRALRAYISTIERPVFNEDLGIYDTKYIDGNEVFPILMKMLSGQKPNDIIPYIEVLTEILQYDKFSEHADDIKAIYNNLIDRTGYNSTDKTFKRNSQLEQMFIEAFHGIDISYIMFDVKTSIKEIQDEHSTVKFTEHKVSVIDKTIQEEQRRVRDSIVDKVKHTLETKKIEDIQWALDDINLLVNKTNAEQSRYLEVDNYFETLENYVARYYKAMKAIGMEIPPSLIRLSLLADYRYVNKYMANTVGENAEHPTNKHYNQNITLVKNMNFLEREFFVDLAKVANNIKNNKSNFILNFNESDKKDNPYKMMFKILRKSAYYISKYNPTDIPTTIKNAANKPIYRFVKYNPIFQLTEEIREQGLKQAILNDNYGDRLMSFIKDNDMFKDLLDDKDNENARLTKLFLDNLQPVLFGGVNQSINNVYKEGNTYNDIDPRTQYVVAINSFLNRFQDTAYIDNKWTNITMFMRQYHQLESTNTNFLIPALYQRYFKKNNIETPKEERHYSGNNIFAPVLLKVIEQEYNRIQREWNTREERLRKFISKEANDIVFEYNGTYLKDGSVSVETNDKGQLLKAYRFHKLGTFFETNKELEGILIESAKENKAFRDVDKTDLIAKLPDYAKEEFNAFITDLEKYKVFENGQLKYKQSNIINDRLEKKENQTPVNSVYTDDTELLEDLFYNYWYNMLMVNELLDGDMAMNVGSPQDYIKRQKRNAASGPVMKGRTFKTVASTTIKGFIHPSYKWLGTYYSLQQIKYDNRLSDELKEEFIQAFSEAFKGNTEYKHYLQNVFDGQAYSTLMHLIDQFESKGEINPDITGLLIDKHFRPLTYEEHELLRQNHVSLNSKKTVVSGRHHYDKMSEAYIDRNDVSEIIVRDGETLEETYMALRDLYGQIYNFRKLEEEENSSYQELIKDTVSQIHKYFKPQPGREMLHLLLNSMEYHQIDQFSDAEAPKIATPLPIQIYKPTQDGDLYNNNINLNNIDNGYIDFNMYIVAKPKNNKYFQTETPITSEQVKVAIQKKVLMPTHIDIITEYLQAKNIEISDTDKKAIAELHNMLSEYNLSLKDVVESRYNYVKNIIQKDGIIEIGKIYDVIREALVEQNAPNNMLDIFTVNTDGTPKYNQNMPVIRPMLMYYIFSLYSNNITDERATGEHYYHETDAFYQVKIDKNGNTVFTQDYLKNPSAYEGISARPLSSRTEVKNGITYHYVEVMIPKPLFENEREEKFWLENIKRGFGTRIPVEGHRSMVVFEVVDFLDSAKGNNIVMPYFAHMLAGSDFDIDSLYAQLYSYYRNINGDYVVYGDYSKYKSKIAGQFMEFMQYMSEQDEMRVKVKEYIDYINSIRETEEDRQYILRDTVKLHKDMIVNNTLSEFDYVNQLVRLQAMRVALQSMDLPNTLDKFKKAKEYHNIVGRVHQNRNLTASINILSNDAVFKYYYINELSSTEALESILRDTFGMDINKLTAWRNIFTLTSLVKAKEDSGMNKIGISIAANMNKFIALASQYKFKLKSEHIVWKYNTTKTNDKGELVLDKKISLDTFGGFNEKNERILTWVGNILGMFADGVKKPIPVALGMNEVNTPVSLAMIGLKLDPRFVFALNMMPDVKEAVMNTLSYNYAISSSVNQSQGYFSSELEKISERLISRSVKIRTDLDKILIQRQNVFGQNIYDIDSSKVIIDTDYAHIKEEDVLSGNIMPEDIGINVRIIRDGKIVDVSPNVARFILVRMYANQAEQTWDIRNAGLIMNMHKKLKPDTTSLDSMIRETEKLINDESIFTKESISDMFDNDSVYSIYYDIMKDLERQLANIFIDRNEKMLPFVKQLGSLANNSEIGQLMVRYFALKNIVSTYKDGVRLTKHVEEEKQLLKEAFTIESLWLNNLKQEVAEARTKYPDNVFLKYINISSGQTKVKVFKNNNTQYDSYVKLFSKTAIKGDLANDFYNDYEQLFRNKETRLLAKKLFFYDLMRTGFGYKDASFSRFIPAGMLKEISDRLDKFITSLNDVKQGADIKSLLKNYMKFKSDTELNDFMKEFILQTIYKTSEEKQNVIKPGYINYWYDKKTKEFRGLASFIDVYFAKTKQKTQVSNTYLFNEFNNIIQDIFGYRKGEKNLELSDIFPSHTFTMETKVNSEYFSSNDVLIEIGKKLRMKYNPETKKFSFPLYLKIENSIYLISEIDGKDVTDLGYQYLEAVINNKDNILPEGIKVKYDKIDYVKLPDYLSPLSFDSEQLKRYKDYTKGQKVVAEQVPEEVISVSNIKPNIEITKESISLQGLKKGEILDIVFIINGKAVTSKVKVIDFINQGKNIDYGGVEDILEIKLQNISNNKEYVVETTLDGDVKSQYFNGKTIDNPDTSLIRYKSITKEQQTTQSISYYEGDINPENNTVFVFGSNPVGINGNPERGTGGAALVALKQFGVKQGEKMDNKLSDSGNAYGLTTVTYPGKKLSMTPQQITEGIKKLYETARANPQKQFKVAYRNTTAKSLNGYTGLEMIEMFNQAGLTPSNVIFSKEWVDTGKLNNTTQPSTSLPTPEQVKEYLEKNRPVKPATTDIKPGVAELFESNSELANEVYSKLLTNSDISAENLLSLLEKDNVVEKDCTGGGKLKAEKGLATSFTKGSQWEVVKDLKGYPSHAQGGVDIKLGKGGFSFTRGSGQIMAAHGLVLPAIKAQDGLVVGGDDDKFKLLKQQPYVATQDNTYVAPKVVIPLEQKKKQQYIPREQPILKADTRTEQQRKIAQEYTESVLNPSIGTQIGEAFQKPLRWLADPVKGVGDIVSAVSPRSALAKDLPNTNEETFEYRKKQLNPDTSNKEKINNTINEAIPLTNWALLNTLPVEVAAGNVIKSSKNLIKPVSGIINKADDVINIGNKSWKKYVTQEEKVERMLAQKDKIKTATLKENQLSLEEKINPFKVEDTGLGDDYKDIINLSKGNRRHNPGMTYEEFENAAKTWASKRNDDLAPDMASLGSARHNTYWGISKDFKGLPEDADAVRKFAYNKFYASGTPEQKLIVENAVKNHEIDHFLYKNSRKEYDDIIKAFDPNKFGIDAKYLKGRKSSIAGDEIRARMAQLMDYFEFKVNPKTGYIEDAFGNKTFTQKHLDYAKKNYIKDTNLDNNMSSFFNGIVNNKMFIKSMNNTALGTIPIMLYLQSQNNKTE